MTAGCTYAARLVLLVEQVFLMPQGTAGISSHTTVIGLLNTEDELGLPLNWVINVICIVAD